MGIGIDDYELILLSLYLSLDFVISPQHWKDHLSHGPSCSTSSQWKRTPITSCLPNWSDFMGKSWEHDDDDPMVTNIYDNLWPLVMRFTACDIENGPVEILWVFPARNGDFPVCYVNVYQREEVKDSRPSNKPFQYPAVRYGDHFNNHKCHECHFSAPLQLISY